MYKRRIKTSAPCCITLLVAAVFISACSKGEGVNYCKNHGPVHSDHLETVAVLTIETTDAGDLAGSLLFPRAAFGEEAESDLTSLFGDASTTFAMQTERPCVVSVTSVSVDDEGLSAQFAASCGADNKLGRINVSLFDNFANLEEVETSMTTSATSKHFVISRQCDSPIFRLD